MKLSSPRTWLLIGGALALLAGAVVVYVIKNPPLPPGWARHEEKRYHVALPPGTGRSTTPDPWTIRYIHDLEKHGRVSIYSQDMSWMGPLHVEEVLDEHVKRWSDPKLPARVIKCEPVTWRSYPARTVTVNWVAEPVDHQTSKHFVVLAKDWLHEIIVDLADGEISEEDADFLFRSFRPR